MINCNQEYIFDSLWRDAVGIICWDFCRKIQMKFLIINYNTWNHKLTFRNVFFSNLLVGLQLCRDTL